MPTIVETTNECVELLQALGYQAAGKEDKMKVAKGDKSYTTTIMGEDADSFIAIPLDFVDCKGKSIFDVDTECISFVHWEKSESDTVKAMYSFKKEVICDFANLVWKKLQQTGMYGFTDDSKEDQKRIHVHYKNSGYIAALHLKPELLETKLAHVKQILKTVKDEGSKVEDTELQQNDTDNDFNW